MPAANSEALRRLQTTMAAAMSSCIGGKYSPGRCSSFIHWMDKRCCHPTCGIQKTELSEISFCLVLRAESPIGGQYSCMSALMMPPLMSIAPAAAGPTPAVRLGRSRGSLTPAVPKTQLRRCAFIGVQDGRCPRQRDTRLMTRNDELMRRAANQCTTVHGPESLRRRDSRQRCAIGGVEDT